MTTVSDGGAASSPRASWLFMPASRTGQVSVRNLRPETPAISSAYIPPSRKTGQVLVRTLRHAKTGFQPDKMAMSGGLKLVTRSTAFIALPPPHAVEPTPAAIGGSNVRAAT